MNGSEVHGFSNILNEIYDEHGFYTKPGDSFNMDETGCHIYNEPGEPLATKRVGEFILLLVLKKEKIACCNVEGSTVEGGLRVDFQVS